MTDTNDDTKRGRFSEDECLGLVLDEQHAFLPEKGICQLKKKLAPGTSIILNKNQKIETSDRTFHGEPLPNKTDAPNVSPRGKAYIFEAKSKVFDPKIVHPDKNHPAWKLFVDNPFEKDEYNKIVLSVWDNDHVLDSVRNKLQRNQKFFVFNPTRFEVSKQNEKEIQLQIHLSKNAQIFVPFPPPSEEAKTSNVDTKKPPIILDVEEPETPDPKRSESSGETSSEH